MAEPEYDRIELARAIEEVRAQIVQAINEGADSPVAFRAGPVELEFQVAFTSSRGGKGGVDVWVLSAEGKGDVARSATTKLKVSLTPVDRQGKEKLIGSVGDY